VYNRGTLAQFNSWHNTAMAAENIPNPEGKIGYVNGQPAPDSQRTTAYSQAIQHPLGGDDYIWLCGNYCSGDVYTLLEVQELGWFNE
jgi:hypothetical protein